MNYNPHKKTIEAVTAYFDERQDRFPGVTNLLNEFLTLPSLETSTALMKCYFGLHKTDDVESLRVVTSVFADKALVKSIVDSILQDEEALAGIAARSYPHPIGFDKLVLFDDKDTGFKFRLHIYWRGNQRAAMERTHLHRFEMASAIVTGELTNHTWQVSAYRPETDLLPEMEIPARDNDSEGERKTMTAYSGYWRDSDGVLHKKILGECDMLRADSQTFISGRSYAQILSDAHYVETNAETGTSNGDVCSTIYVHSGGLKDQGNRGIPVLFEDFRLACDDQIITPIAELDAETLRSSLEHYRSFLQDSLDFYEWLYDPKHGRDLSVGMIAGYLLSEEQHSPHTISKWINDEENSKAILDRYSRTLEKIIQGDMSIGDMSDDDRTKRYFDILIEKAERDPRGKDRWLELNGDLVKEMWRYCGALKGEKPDITVLKPIWQEVVGKKMPGGAHYGHIAAMIEAAYEANGVALKYFNSGLMTDYKKDGSPVCDADPEIEALIKEKLSEYYPDYEFAGEESGRNDLQPVEGSRRWLVDPIDGTRNFLSGRDDFCVSIACQQVRNGVWTTTDGVISVPVSGKIFWAEENKGAYLIERDDLEKELHINPAHQPDTLKNHLIDISISGFGVQGEAHIIKSLREQGAVYRATGSSAMMLAIVAGKGSDGVIMTAHDYDIAAAELIAKEAGATISHFNFERGSNSFEATVASNAAQSHHLLAKIAYGAVVDTMPKALRPDPHPG